MLKRILAFGICLALVCGYMCISTSAQSDGFVMWQDYADQGFENFAIANGQGNVEYVTDDKGNGVIDLSLGAGTGNAVGVIDSGITPDVRGSAYTVQFDVNAIDVSGPLLFVVKNPGVTAKWMGVNIFPSNFGTFTPDSPDGLVNGGDDAWFTVRIAVDETKYVAGDNVNNVFTVGIRKKGETTWKTYNKSPGGTYVEKEGMRPIVAGNNHIRFEPTKGNIGIGIANVAFNAFATKTPHYQIDNVTVYSASSTVVSGAWFEDSAGNVLNEVEDGEIIANFDVNNGGGLDSATAVFAVYGVNGEFITMTTQDVTLDEKNTTVSASFDASDVEYGRIEAFLCEDNSLTPIAGIKGVLGTYGIVENSETSADLGTEDGDGNYRFSTLDRSTLVNKVTLEGEHASGERTAVTVKTVGKTSGNTLYFRQFSTKADGTFKIDFEIVPMACEDDEMAVISVLAADTRMRTVEIPVFSNWDSMILDFEGIEDADDAKSFIDEYYDNLSRFESGSEDETNADVTDISYSEMAFIKVMNVFEVATYEDAVDAVLNLIEKTRAAEEFVEDFASAQALETEEEKIAAIKELITECEIIEFSTVGASNVDAICKAIITSEGVTIEEIYADFYEAYVKQKNAEESTVPDYTSITDGQGIKAFFEKNREVLGVDPDKYTDDDYAVMYGVYEEKAYSDLDSYEAVNAAIVFLDKYIIEYNQFIALFTDAATIEKNVETIRTLLNNTYSYIKIDLADETAVVNKEYLYARMIDADCTSLETIENAFADAVEMQTKYEISAKDAFITIIDTTSVKAYFAEYADMMGVSDAKNYTDAELGVFVELYEKFRPTASDYTEAKAQTENLIAKHKTAMKLLADINSKSEAKDWTAIKALFEGADFEEFIGIDVSTPDVTDIRALYMRVANGAPYDALAAVKNAWKKAYDEQVAYEAVAGGYESFDDEMFYFDDSAWNLKVQGNVITIEGKTDALGERYITFFAKCDETFIYVKQIKTKGTGEFGLRFILNPEMYGDAEEAVLSITGDTMNTYTFSSIPLYSEAELSEMVDGFLNIDSKTELKNYINDYADILGIQLDADNDRFIEAMYFLYDKDKKASKYDAILDVDRVLNGFDDDGMLSIMTRMEEMIACLDELTDAANKKVGSTVGQWKKIKVQVQKAIDNQWISPDVSGKISDEASMYLLMSGKTYEYMKDVEDAYEDAYDRQYKTENTESGKKPSGGGGGGGGTGSGSKLPIQSVSGDDSGRSENLTLGEDYLKTETDIKTNQPSHPESPFVDITSEYSWAQDSIDRLRRYGLVNGDGNGNFRPGDGISREEFVVLLLRVFSVETKSSEVSFTDVRTDAWYYDAVATAYEMGIVKGYPDGSFGIGNNVSRSDMAVMVCRTMEVLGINLDATEKAVVFTDRKQIPEYAYHSVSKLQQAGVVKGDDVGNFNPQNNLSRAEAAVVFSSVFTDINEFVTYAGQKIY